MKKFFPVELPAALRRLAAGLSFALALAFMLSAPAAAADAQPLVSPAWLNGHLHDANLMVLDIRSAIDGSKPETFAQGHIPGAVHSDYDKAGWRVTRNNVPFMVPTTPELEKLIGDLGIDETSHVVVVPAGVNVLDFGSAARTYWTLKYAGVARCLDPRRRPRRLEGGGLCARQGRRTRHRRRSSPRASTTAFWRSPPTSRPSRRAAAPLWSTRARCRSSSARRRRPRRRPTATFPARSTSTARVSTIPPPTG